MKEKPHLTDFHKLRNIRRVKVYHTVLQTEECLVGLNEASTISIEHQHSPTATPATHAQRTHIYDPFQANF